VIWVQGCTLGCPGCFNPATHPADGGTVWQVADLAAWVHAQDDPGLTISGGEPLQQAAAVTALLVAVARPTILFSGHTLAEIERRPGGPALLAHVDLLVAGRYVAGRRLGTGLLGSTNQRLHFLRGRIGPEALAALPAAEVRLTPDGQVQVSGIDPPQLG
jgi:anaerobic ribonucleoside-triphosphate reductase activating protein